MPIFKSPLGSEYGNGVTSFGPCKGSTQHNVAWVAWVAWVHIFKSLSSDRGNGVTSFGHLKISPRLLAEEGSSGEWSVFFELGLKLCWILA